jgi:hypothetical protein
MGYYNANNSYTFKEYPTKLHSTQKYKSNKKANIKTTFFVVKSASVSADLFSPKNNTLHACIFFYPLKFL